MEEKLLLLKESLCDCVPRNFSLLKLHSNHVQPYPNHVQPLLYLKELGTEMRQFPACLLLLLAKGLRQSWKCSTPTPRSPGHGRASSLSHGASAHHKVAQGSREAKEQGEMQAEMYREDDSESSSGE